MSTLPYHVRYRLACLRWFRHPMPNVRYCFFWRMWNLADSRTDCDRLWEILQESLWDCQRTFMHPRHGEIPSDVI